MELDEAVMTNNRPSYWDNGNLDASQISHFDVRVTKKLCEEFADVDNDKIKTYLRIRPPSVRHGNASVPRIDPKDTVFFIENLNTLLVRPPQKNLTNDISESRFTYSRVFGQESVQSVIYDTCVRNVLNGFFEGGNGLIFSYGATNSGKTYTMQGYGKDFGIVPRTLEHLFLRLEGSLYKKGDIKPHQLDSYVILDPNSKKLISDAKARILREAKIKPAELSSFVELIGRSASSICSFDVNQSAGISIIGSGSNETVHSDGTIPDKNTLYSVWVSFAEIYNDRVYDLFDTVKRGKRRRELKIFQDKHGRVYIKDLTECYVNTAEEAYQFFLAGKQNLQFASTHVNSNSSRSHSFFNIRMVIIGRVGAHLYPKEVHRFSFCDLAGLERVSQTGNVGIRLKESGNINQSLLVLLRCIRGLRDKQKGNKGEVIPFRDCKLTRLFQSYLTTATQICMIVNINPDPDMIEPSIQVIQNSAVASAIRTFKKIEPPMNDTAFFRKVRQSIGIAQRLKAHQEGREDEMDEEESPQEVSTVKRKNIISMVDQLNGLRAEKHKLERKLQVIEDTTREKLQVEFDKLLNDQRQHYEDLLQNEREHMKSMGKQRMSIVARGFSAGVLNDVNENIPKSPRTNKFEVMNEDADEYRRHTIGTPSISRVPPSTGLMSPDYSIDAKYKKVLLDLKNSQSEIDDMLETINALQDLNDKKTRRIEIADTKEKDLQNTVTALEFEMQSMNSLITEKDETISNLNFNYTKLQKNDFLKQIQVLTTQLQEKEIENEEIRQELQDGENLCCDYHSKLEAANMKNEELTKEVNSLHNENRRQKQDEEMLHLLIEDLQTQVNKLQSEVDSGKLSPFAKKSPFAKPQMVFGSSVQQKQLTRNTANPSSNSERSSRSTTKYSVRSASSVTKQNASCKDSSNSNTPN